MTSIPMDCQFASKPIHWQRFRIVRVPPLNIFGESSRPIRSQDSELSTNQRPRFQQNIWHQPNLSPPNALPLCHCKVTVSLKIHLNQVSPNIYQSMPMDCQFANAMPLEPLLCHFNHWDATQGESHSIGPSLYSTASTQGQGPRSFPSIEGNIRGPCP